MSRRGVRFYGGGRKDKNQNPIVEALEKCGASVIDLSSLGEGIPDLLVGFKGKSFLIEIKNPENSYGRGGLNARQRTWHANWKGQVAIARSIKEALNIVGAELAVGLDPEMG